MEHIPFKDFFFLLSKNFAECFKIHITFHKCISHWYRCLKRRPEEAINQSSLQLTVRHRSRHPLLQSQEFKNFLTTIPPVYGLCFLYSPHLPMNFNEC
ncbi:hypothetical protein GDO78_015218 [Eleutherodactylus coqui]|uniref:Uncharacterized protein n=1 Tax=Eleutherodactylus coqui TaxID=57060 RepID=A0A8J6ELW1_ELECQ|nr:hypothetical protein GDO78_015218 [Eleutherodactylus coqui]